jgi:hypothetical protein
MEPLQWLFITTALTLVFVVFAINPMQAATDEAIANSARLEARRLASAINILSTAPDGATFAFDMPNTRCRVKITGNLVDMKITYLSGQEISETVGIIKTVPVIAEEEFDCKSTPRIKLTKTNGELRVTRG